ncbi:Protein of uncharacterised function (DUF3311) [Achromobacter spanius]|uniref:DUF3311 domain-containing protein n=1 Tax=Achromobacter spanius TaxID=217203 RepID=UPI000C2BEBAD|nr:DUF3311 domain-containing protein [Achromobacter spanius]AUA58846.1 hypothetical protein CVS48_24250 [Achromobacter spanius]CAB3672743.1 hypothetical protein LMG5911_03564 [Achromobacter spanius]SPT38779.1 Protein of uncharacterised function (DUF3311) [Achromobacter denitrificans]VEE58994.1 Protein of uncharacterised function (DUF3311) [Achromobacter spanius]
MFKSLLSLLVGLVVPYVSVMSGIYYFRFSETFILGFPALYFWIFIWFLLTPVCLSISWQLDKKHFPEDAAEK